MKKFKAKNGSRLSDDKANAYGMEIFRLMKHLDKDDVQPEDVLEDAKRKTAAYHNEFEWDDEIAGNSYRIDQARYLLRSIVKIEIVRGNEEEVRAFHYVTINDDAKSYVPSEIVFEDKDMSAEIIEQAISEARSWYARYNAYQELSGIAKAIKRELDLVGV